METRIGVFLCNCGGAIKNIDFDTVVKKITKLPGVSCVNLSSNLCLEDGRKKMLSDIREKSIEKVVVAACSPEFQEHVFRGVLEEAGLNGYLLSMANIREQCSWAHEGDVTEKAVDLVKMAVNRARLLQPVDNKELPVNREVLVVGGGFSATNVALQLSQLGLQTTVLEEDAVLGGGVGALESFYGFGPNLTISAVQEDKNIEILTSAEEMVAKVVPVKEEVIAVEAPVAVAEVEVIKKGKIEEEGVEGEAPAAGAEAKKPAEAAKKEEKK